jgi:integrase
MPNGSGTLLIRQSKTDAAGEGARTYLSHDTVRWLRQWLGSSGIEEGSIFRRLIGQNRVGDRLHADIVADIYKRVARWIGMVARQVDQVSGHSVRVGAAQDLLALNIDLASIMQAGRWKSSRMPMRYGEEILAARGGMTRAASAQGRDSQ